MKFKKRIKGLKDLSQTLIFQAAYDAGLKNDLRDSALALRREADAGLEEQALWEEGFALGQEVRKGPRCEYCGVPEARMAGTIYGDEWLCPRHFEENRQMLGEVADE